MRETQGIWGNNLNIFIGSKLCVHPNIKKPCDKASTSTILALLRQLLTPASLILHICKSREKFSLHNVFQGSFKM